MRLRNLAAAACVSVLCCALPAAASAQSEPEQATLHASFSPDRLGAGTTIGFSFTVKTADGLAPPPLTGMDLHMPAGMNYTETTLGLAECSKKTLEALGASACPGNSRMGTGTAYVEVPFGKGAGHELPKITAFMGPTHNGNMVVLFYVDGVTPVYGQYIFTGEVLPASGLFGIPVEHGDPAGAERPGRSRRLDRARQRRDRPQRRHLPHARARQAAVVPSARDRGAGTLSQGRLPLPRRIQLPGRHDRAGKRCRGVSEGGQAEALSARSRVGSVQGAERASSSDG